MRSRGADPRGARALRRAFAAGALAGWLLTAAAFLLVPRRYTAVAWVVAGEDADARPMLRDAAREVHVAETELRMLPQGVLVSASAPSAVEAQRRGTEAVHVLRAAVERRLVPASAAELPDVERRLAASSSTARDAAEALFTFEHDEPPPGPAVNQGRPDARRAEVIALAAQMDDPDPQVALRARVRLNQLSLAAAQEQERALSKKLKDPAARKAWEGLVARSDAATAELAQLSTRAQRLRAEEQAARDRLREVIRHAEDVPLPEAPSSPKPLPFVAIGAALGLAVGLLAASAARPSIRRRSLPRDRAGGGSATS